MKEILSKYIGIVPWILGAVAALVIAYMRTQDIPKHEAVLANHEGRLIRVEERLVRIDENTTEIKAMMREMARGRRREP